MTQEEKKEWQARFYPDEESAEKEDGEPGKSFREKENGKEKSGRTAEQIPEQTPEDGSGGDGPEQGQKGAGKGMKQPRRRPDKRVIFGLCCLALAAVFLFFALALAKGSREDRVGVIRVVREVEAGQKILGEDLSLVTLPREAVPRGALGDLSAAVGQTAAMDLVPGDYLFPAKLEKEGRTDAPALGKDRFLMAVRVADLPSGLCGRLKSGDVIRLYAVGTGEISAYASPRLSALEVYAVSDAQGGQEGTTAALLLYVGPEQAEELAGLSHTMSLHAVLLARGGTPEAKAYLGQDEEKTEETEEVRDGLD